MIEYALKYLYRVFHLIDYTVDQLYEILIIKTNIILFMIFISSLLHLREKSHFLEVYLFKI
jgi:hypothetical protein